MTSTLRPELPEPTERIARLPVHRGYPVPWFVAWLDKDGNPVERGNGEPDFRILYPDAAVEAHKYGLCWICGQRLGSHRTFVVGPMCAVNRVSAEPPMHLDCAMWSVEACPFLTRPHMTRREGGLPEATKEPPGVMLRRNPGVILVWVTRKYTLKPAPGGFLFDMGDPVTVAFYSHGRPATRAEVEESIDSGIPTLREMAEQQGPSAVRQLERQVKTAMQLLPAV